MPRDGVDWDKGWIPGLRLIPHVRGGATEPAGYSGTSPNPGQASDRVVHRANDDLRQAGVLPGRLLEAIRASTGFGLLDAYVVLTSLGPISVPLHDAFNHLNGRSEPKSKDKGSTSRDGRLQGVQDPLVQIEPKLVSDASAAVRRMYQ